MFHSESALLKSAQNASRDERLLDESPSELILAQALRAQVRPVDEGPGDNLVSSSRTTKSLRLSRLGLPGPVFALTVLDMVTGPDLIVGGGFSEAGGAPANRMAKWNGSQWSALGSGIDFRVSALTAFNDGTGPALYAGGLFTIAGGQTLIKYCCAARCLRRRCA